MFTKHCTFILCAFCVLTVRGFTVDCVIPPNGCVNYGPYKSALYNAKHSLGSDSLFDSVLFYYLPENMTVDCDLTSLDIIREMTRLNVTSADYSKKMVLLDHTFWVRLRGNAVENATVTGEINMDVSPFNVVIEYWFYFVIALAVLILIGFFLCFLPKIIRKCKQKVTGLTVYGVP